MTRFERVLLYIGAPKTGTTSVQIMLWKNRPALMDQGIYIPLAGRGGIDQHIELPAIVLQGEHREDQDRHAGLSGVDKETRRRSFLRDLEKEFRSCSPCHTLLLFSEHMFYSTAAEIPLYRKLLSPYAAAFECLMYLRRQDRWLASLNLQIRKAAAHSDLTFNPMPPAQYGDTVRAWDSVSDRCHIRRFDREFLVHGEVVADFCAAAGLDIDKLSASGIHANRTILQEQMELVDALNSRLLEIAPARRVLIRRGFLPLCTEVLGGTDFKFPRGAAMAAFEAYRDINRWLHLAKDPEGPELFFDDDFSDYQTHPRNDSRYGNAQLSRLLSVIQGRLGDQGVAAMDAPARPSRTELIEAIVSAFMSLRRAQLHQASGSQARRAQ